MEKQIKARQYAINCHTETNHLYDGKPYYVHLQKVVDVANNYIHIIPSEFRDVVLSACWCHDVIEDCRQTYNDVKEALGAEVAELVYAVTNDKGKNRKERAGANYYHGIRHTKYAAFVKLCDRIANFEYSIETESRMADMYRKENDEFLAEIYDADYIDLINYLKDL